MQAHTPHPMISPPAPSSTDCENLKSSRKECEQAVDKDGIKECQVQQNSETGEWKCISEIFAEILFSKKGRENFSNEVYIMIPYRSALVRKNSTLGTCT
jgi:hypothetical protein